MKLFNLVLGSIVGVSTLGVTPAFAGSNFECNRTRTNWVFCSQDNGDVNSDVITMTSPDNKEFTKLEIVCLGGGSNRWKSYGTMTKDQNQVLANHWCENY